MTDPWVFIPAAIAWAILIVAGAGILIDRLAYRPRRNK
jgi:branched-subunit amino acid ABC-type transport system permease component